MDPTIQIELTINNETFQAEILEGSLEFIRAQNLLVDKEAAQVILSGRFDMKLVINGEAVTLSDGRFDLGIGPDSFFVL
jgi:hypothetical protein